MSPSATGSGKAAPLRILIADDHPVVREGLVTILSLQDDLEVVGQACDGEEACRLYGQLRPDILILDLRMPKKDGLEVAQPPTHLEVIEFQDEPAERQLQDTFKDAVGIVRSTNGAASPLAESLLRAINSSPAAGEEVVRRLRNRVVHSSGVSRPRSRTR
jgi:DNA-binding NarL/FixJ family response regulator